MQAMTQVRPARDTPVLFWLAYTMRKTPEKKEPERIGRTVVVTDYQPNQKRTF